MASSLHRIFHHVPPTQKAMAIPAVALSAITSKGNTAVYASADTLFKGAIFGRDSLEVAEDFMDYRPKLVRHILTTIGRLQGLTENHANEEEPGKIIHEYRTKTVDGKPIRGKQLEIFHDLSQKWGGNDTELAYYGSIDATPQFIRALASYCQKYGDSILDETVRRRDKKTVTMRVVTEQATSWLMDKLSGSSSGLLEYQRVNPHGIENQVWKDSAEFYVHENKEWANHSKPIASIEVQGLAYDALIAAAHFFPDKAETYTKAANQLRTRTITLLWQADRTYFALGTDYDSDGQLRIIRTKTANPGALLDSSFFDDLPIDEQQLYISSIVRTILSTDFLTDAGIRSRALSGQHLVDHWDYHGSYVSWPKETYDIAKGLRRQAMPRLARQLENRLLNIVLRTQEYPEFVYVDEWNRVLGGAPTTRQHGEFIHVAGNNKPERIQAWTVSAVMAILARRTSRKGKHTTHHEQWRTDLEAKTYANIPHIDRYINPLTLRSRYPGYKYRLNGDPRA